jgi:hypothetical protein
MSALEIESGCATLIKWKLANFSTVASRDDPNKELESDFFQLDSCSIKFCLLFCPTNNKDSGDKNYSSISLHVADFNGNASVKLRFKFWIENEFGYKTAETSGINL